MNKKMIDELEKVCTPVVELLRREYDPHCTIIIDSKCIRLVRDEVGIPYKETTTIEVVEKTAPEVPVQEQSSDLDKLFNGLTTYP